jgi:hypothetical protein
VIVAARSTAKGNALTPVCGRIAGTRIALVGQVSTFGIDRAFASWVLFVTTSEVLASVECARVPVVALSIVAALAGAVVRASEVYASIERTGDSVVALEIRAALTSGC